MAGITMRISAFADEVSDHLDEQLTTLRELGIGGLELRGVWGKNVADLTDAEVATLAAACRDAGITISAIGSPVGKTSIVDPLEAELARLARMFEIAEQTQTETIRVFSFYRTGAETWENARLLDESARRLTAMAEAAARADKRLVLENEYGLVGDTVAQCAALLQRVPSPQLGFAWDPGNFVHVGERAAVSTGWEAIGPRIRHVHVKDMRFDSQEVVVAGAGDGQMRELLAGLKQRGYQGYLALEPHLIFAGKSHGFSGPTEMGRAYVALRSLLEELAIDVQ